MINIKRQKSEMRKVLPHEHYFRFHLTLPKGYPEEMADGWPMILFLHGAGERGDDIERIMKHGIPKVVDEIDNFPFVTVSPQCPEDLWWPELTDSLTVLLDHVIENYSIDQKRVYLTGLSMGGYGTWHLSVKEPERFAAIAPVCGGGFPLNGFPQNLDRIVHVPVWVFHGEKDPLVPVKESRVLVDYLESHGGKVRFTIYPDAEHDSWTPTYSNPELYEWFMSNSLK